MKRTHTTTATTTCTLTLSDQQWDLLLEAVCCSMRGNSTELLGLQHRIVRALNAHQQTDDDALIERIETEAVTTELRA